MRTMIVVRADWDETASVWVATSDDLPGLVAEAPTVEALSKKLPGMILDLLEDGDDSNKDGHIYKLIAETEGRISSRAA